jgi:Flp pilus assembly protein CpaB
MQWQTWPATSTSNTFIRRAERPDATTQVTGSIARAPFIAGEPIREQKLVRADGSGFMAAILPTGMRAISTEISPETGAGGFILPNDRVDVILSKREKNPERSGPDVVNSEIILSNVRVLAIDQAPKAGRQNAGGQDRHASNSSPSRPKRWRVPPERTLAGAAQHHRRQRHRAGPGHAPQKGAGQWFAMAPSQRDAEVTEGRAKCDREKSAGSGTLMAGALSAAAPR